MALITRRMVLAAGGTLAVALAPRKPSAKEDLPDLAQVLTPTAPPVVPADVPFFGADGSAHHLAEFRGHGMVVNLWATWCAPCVAEMPSLEKLSVTLAPSDIAVLPLSSDHGGVATISAWYQQHGISGLPILTDPKGELARAWNARGIPMTVIIDRQGREVARLEGAADWDTPIAIALVKKLVG